MPLLHAARAGDRNTLHPGTFTVIPARNRPPTDESMLPPPPPGFALRGIPIDETHEHLRGAPTQEDIYEAYDLTLMGLDAKRQREQLATITDEPGDAVTASAVASHAVQATATFEPLPMTLEERVDRAIQLHGLLPDRLLKPKEGEKERNLEEYVQFGQVRKTYRPDRRPDRAQLGLQVQPGSRQGSDSLLSQE
jgi:hypothetical protein